MNDQTTYYYIVIPQKTEDQHRLDGLLNGLEAYYEIATRNVIQVAASHPSLDPIFSKLAAHVVHPLPPTADPETSQPKPEPSARKRRAGRTRSGYAYTLPGGEKLSKSEMQARLDLEEIEIGTRVVHYTKGELVVVQNGAEYVLEPASE